MGHVNSTASSRIHDFRKQIATAKRKLGLQETEQLQILVDTEVLEDGSYTGNSVLELNLSGAKLLAVINKSKGGGITTIGYTIED